MQIQDESYIKWKLFLEGNDEAYSWLYTHHIQLLYQYGLQITPDTEVIKAVSYTHLTLPTIA
mgnify:FL=1